MTSPDIVSIDGFPFPREFEEQIIAPYVKSVKFLTDSFWNIGARLIISGRGLYHQSATTLELLSMGETAEELFTFYALVEVRLNAAGGYCTDADATATICTEKHTFTAFFNKSRITRLDYHSYTVVDSCAHNAPNY